VRAEAKVIVEAWRRHYNQVRPHSSSIISRRTSSWLEQQDQRRNATGGVPR